MFFVLAAFLLLGLGRLRDVMIQELSELHDHEGGHGVGDVGVRVELAAHHADVGQLAAGGREALEYARDYPCERVDVMLLILEN